LVKRFTFAVSRRKFAHAPIADGHLVGDAVDRETPKPEISVCIGTPQLATDSPTCGFHDECLHGDVKFSLGFMKPNPFFPFGSTSAFGSPGAGGSLGFADPNVGVGYAYVTSQMGPRLIGDPRDAALRRALASAVQA